MKIASEVDRSGDVLVRAREGRAGKEREAADAAHRRWSATPTRPTRSRSKPTALSD